MRSRGSFRQREVVTEVIFKNPKCLYDPPHRLFKSAVLNNWPECLFSLNLSHIENWSPIKQFRHIYSAFDCQYHEPFQA